MRQWLFVLAGVLCLSPAFAAEKARKTTFNFGEVSQLTLSIPPGWKEIHKKTLDQKSISIGFYPGKGDEDAFRVTITAAKTVGVLTLDEIKTILENLIEVHIKPQAIETEFPLTPLDGNSLRGLYFSATDRGPKPGEYKYIIQGEAFAGDGTSRVMFTILTNDGGEETAKQALAMLKGISIKE
jgi:hypothetical protein